MKTEIALSLRNLAKSFGQTEIIRGVSLDISKGERHAIIGPNGAGKTTLFNLISGRFPRWGKPRRIAVRTTDALSLRVQPEDRKVDGARDPADAARARR